MKVTVDGSFSAKQIFPSLNALPWPLDTSNCWQIYTSSVKPFSELHCASTMPMSKIRIWPDTDVMCWKDNAGIFHASVEGATVQINPQTKDAHFYFAPNSLAKAKRLGRLVIIEILRHEGCFTVHAGVVETSGGAVLICGASGMGKSTLTTVWACIGNGRFMADDRCIIFRRDGMLWAGGIADVLGMRPETANLMAKLDIRLPSKAQQGDDKLFYDCHDFFLTLCQNPYPVKAIFFLDDISKNKNEICRCSPEEAFERIWQGSFYPSTSRVMQTHFDLLSDLSTHVPAYIIQGQADCRSTIAKLDCLMAKHASLAYPIYPQASQYSLRVPPHRTDFATKMLCRIISVPESQERSVPRDDEEWRDILQSADRYGLLPLLAATLDIDALFRQCGNPVSNVLHVALREASKARRIHLEILGMILTVFRARDIRWAVVDGPSIAERFYGVAASRYYHRFHILVDPDNVDLAVESLCDLGFSVLGGTSAEQFSCGSKALILRNSIRLYEICICTPLKKRASLGRNVFFDVPVFLQTAETIFVEGIEIPVVCKSYQILLSCLAPANYQQPNSFINLYDIALMSRLASQQVCDDVVAKASHLQCVEIIQQAVQQACKVFPCSEPVQLQQALCQK